MTLQKLYVFLTLIFVSSCKFSLDKFNYRFGKEECNRLFVGPDHYDYRGDVYKLTDGTKCQYCECEPSKQEGGCIRCLPARLSDHVSDLGALAEGCYLTRPGEIHEWDACCPNKKICPDGPTAKYFNRTRLNEMKELYKGYQLSVGSPK